MDTQSHKPAAAAPPTRPPRPRRRFRLEPQLNHEHELELVLDRLYRAHARDLRKFVIANGMNSGDAEELVNDAFLAVYRAMEKRAGPLDEPKAYLYKVAIYKMRGHRKRNHERQPRLDRVQQLETADARLDPPDATTHIDDLDELSCQTALAALPVRQREAFLLRRYFEFSVAEIADVMGISINAVKTHLERARNRLAGLARKEEAS